ncbi:hypothetical protein XJ20_21945 [Serratia liquefaciens]|nr:hypothetical protein XJ20_21945 [Serratia liquefaciens]
MPLYATKVTPELSLVLVKHEFWCRFTVTRQQSLAAMQAAARKLKALVCQQVQELPESSGVVKHQPANWRSEG